MKITKISSKQDHILRFNTNASIQIFITELELELHPKFNEIVASNIDDKQKMLQIRELAAELALNKLNNSSEELNETKGISFQADDISSNMIDIDRMTYHDMFHPDTYDKEQ